MALHYLEIKGKNIALNSYGYLENYAQWDEDVAQLLAQDEGFELNPCHWQAIYFIRKYFSTYEIPPTQAVLLSPKVCQMHPTNVKRFFS